jgi:hypothetical protein
MGIDHFLISDEKYQGILGHNSDPFSNKEAHFIIFIAYDTCQKLEVSEEDVPR